MKYLNLDVEKVLSSDEFMAEGPCKIGVWLLLLKHCVTVENGGKIADCGDWGDRRWMRTCGITKEEVSESCTLWAWENGTLTVFGYPHQQENVQNIRREAGYIAGLKSASKRGSKLAESKLFDLGFRKDKANRWRSPSNDSESKVQGHSEGDLQGDPERKGKEGKVITHSSSVCTPAHTEEFRDEVAKHVASLNHGTQNYTSVSIATAWLRTYGNNLPPPDWKLTVETWAEDAIRTPELHRIDPKPKPSRINGAPSEDDVVNYAKECNWSEASARKFWRNYETKDWQVFRPCHWQLQLKTWIEDDAERQRSIGGPRPKARPAPKNLPSEPANWRQIEEFREMPWTTLDWHELSPQQRGWVTDYCAK